MFKTHTLWHKEQAERQRHLEIHHLWFSPSQGLGLCKYFFLHLHTPVKYEAFSRQNTMDFTILIAWKLMFLPSQPSSSEIPSCSQPRAAMGRCHSVFQQAAAQEMSFISTERPQVLHQPNHRLGTCLDLG